MPFFFLCFLLGCAPMLVAAPLVGTPTRAPAWPVGTLSNAREEAALLGLRAQWQDPEGHLANWNASMAPLCSWWGVTCTNSSVTSLYLSALSLSGSLSPAIANLSSLSILNLAHNQLTGRLPLELGSLPSLSRLQLGHNLFYGSIPPSLFLSPSLQFLQLENNNLSGELPSSISNLVHLRYLSLEFNAFTGSIPPSITNLTKLAAVFIGFNSFNGTIPLNIGDLHRLVYLYLQNNLLSGPIPFSVGSLSNMKAMDLSHNSFNNTIPEAIGSLLSLQTLDLHGNNLSGIIPASLGNLSMLKYLNLSYNNLSGELPMNGILSHFNVTSFFGNQYLCEGPLLGYECYMTPEPEIAVPPRSSMNRRMPPKLGKGGKITVAVVAGAVGLVVIVVLLVCCSSRTRREEAQERMPNSFSLDVQDSVRRSKLEVYMPGFTHNYEEIVSHAGYYDTAHVIGRGRFATVYRSDLPGGRHLAVKVFNNPITQTTFEREVGHLYQAASQVSTLLPIRGFYSNPIEKAIFYDFMPEGTLQHVLEGAPTLLDWSKRVSIALGIAQALSHLHKGSHFRTLHKDLKSSNVLLDDNLCPLVSDYGLVELVSKALVLTPGYTPPEFMAMSSTSKRYTDKTDIFSFGVVLLELITGKSPIFHIEELEEEVHLVTWVLGLHKEGRGVDVLDAFVVASCPSIDHLIQAFNLAILCLNDEPSQRPTIYEIISMLDRLASKNSPIKSFPLPSKTPLVK